MWEEMVGTIDRGMAIWEIGKVGSSWGGEPEMERSREKTWLGRVLGEARATTSSEQCAFANAFRRFATASATSGGHQALAGRLMLPKGMAEVAASLRSLVKVWMASERESVIKLEGVGQWVSI